MEIREEGFLDRSEPDADGSNDYWYEGTYITFTFDDGRSLRARRYRDTPGEAALFFNEVGPQEDDDETPLAVEWLRQAGVSTARVLEGMTGYRPIWQQRRPPSVARKHPRPPTLL